ncbi:MAG: cell division ATP-binding protein FtsE, partial [Mycoplasmatales bacterium]
FTKDHHYDDVTRILEEERILDFTDMTNDSIRTINLNEDMSEFDYLTEEEVEIENPIEEDSEEDVHKLLDDIALDDTINLDGVELTSMSLDQEYNYQQKSGEQPIIRFENVALSYEVSKVIKDITLDIYPGEFIYFVGPSGAGKSSLVKMIYRDVHNDGGKIFVDGENISSYNSTKLPKLRRKIGVIFQDYKLLNNRTVYDNVNYSLEVIGFPKKKRKEQVLKTLKIVGIIDQKDKFPNELSGGQQQRVAIARAIVDEPKIIVADEPTGNLDPKNAIIIMEILNRINRTGTTIVMATHDVGIVNKYKKRVVLVKDGKVANESEGVYIYE